MCVVLQRLVCVRSAGSGVLHRLVCVNTAGSGVSVDSRMCSIAQTWRQCHIFYTNLHTNYKERDVSFAKCATGHV